jgi:Ca2+-binding RTX toxin-like protein
MVVARAFTRVDMSADPGNTTFLPPTVPALEAAVTSPTQIDVLDPLGRLQQYLGSSNLEDLSLGVFGTSVFTGFNQYATSVSQEASRSYQISDALLNGQQLLDSITSGGVGGLLEVLYGGADQIFGSELGDFNDILCGYGGNDFISGGAGADWLDGGNGVDTLNGNVGNDIVSGGVGDDILRGGRDQDELYGEIGNDTLNGNLGDDTMEGGLGSDLFILSRGFDVIADFSAVDGDRIAVVPSTLPVGGIEAALSDSEDGLLIDRDGFGSTLLPGLTVAGFNPADVILLA